MNNLDKIIRRIEENYNNQNKREKKEFSYKGTTFEVVTLTRGEKYDLFFSKPPYFSSLKDMYDWLKPLIYKSFQLKEAALKAKEEGYINSYYDVIDLLFEPQDTGKILVFLFEINGFENLKSEVVDFIKKQ